MYDFASGIDPSPDVVHRPRMGEKTRTRQPTSIYLTPELHKRLRYLAERQGISMAQVIREACEEHLRRTLAAMTRR